MNTNNQWGALTGNWIHTLLTEEVKNCLPKSNPVVPNGKIWVGFNPSCGKNGTADKVTVKQRMDMLINKLGIQVFLCLQEEFEFQGYNDYRPIAKEVAHEHAKSAPVFLNFPIKDVSVADDQNVLNFLTGLIPKIKKNENLPMYVHCKGGNGRTGTIVSLILTHLYGISAEQSMEFVNQFHDERKIAVYTSPETDEQMNQVRRLAPILNERLKKNK
jgi:Swiss Army Knife protein, DSP-PTPase phosphatase domain